MNFYGLQRIPHRQFEEITSTLRHMGLTASTHAIRIYYYTHTWFPPIYIGLYVNEFFYFSKPNKIEG